MNKGVKQISAGADSGTSTKHSNLGDGTQRFNMGFGYLGKERAYAEKQPLLPKTQISSFSQKQLLSLKLISRWVGEANLAMFELAMPISNLPGLALWDTFWNIFLFWNCTNLLAATPFPAVLLLARTLGTINPVRRAWIYGH